jgi:hypothetical protein
MLPPLSSSASGDKTPRARETVTRNLFAGCNDVAPRGPPAPNRRFVRRFDRSRNARPSFFACPSAARAAMAPTDGSVACSVAGELLFDPGNPLNNSRDRAAIEPTASDPNGRYFPAQHRRGPPRETQSVENASPHLVIAMNSYQVCIRNEGEGISIARLYSGVGGDGLGPSQRAGPRQRAPPGGQRAAPGQRAARDQPAGSGQQPGGADVSISGLQPHQRAGLCSYRQLCLPYR